MTAQRLFTQAELDIMCCSPKEQMAAVLESGNKGAAKQKYNGEVTSTKRTLPSCTPSCRLSASVPPGRQSSAREEQAAALAGSSCTKTLAQPLQNTMQGWG